MGRRGVSSNAVAGVGCNGGNAGAGGVRVGAAVLERTHVKIGRADGGLATEGGAR